MLFFTYLSMCCFFSLFIHMFLYVCILYLCFTLRCLDEFCFKVFQKDKLWKFIMPWTLFLQSFSRVCIRVIFFCIPTSGYEFSDLRLLSWFICLLWFCYGFPKGEIVRTYVRIIRDICYVNWLILWQNTFYL